MKLNSFSLPKKELFMEKNKVKVLAAVAVAMMFFAGCSYPDDTTDGGGNSSPSGGGSSSSSDGGGNQNNNNGPKGVTAVGSSSESITISWNAATGAGVYYVYIAESSSGPYTQLGSTSSLSYTSSNLATATTFYYKVEAKTGTYGTILGQSPVVSATTLLKAPSGVKAESLTSSSITVSWNDFPNATAYRIYKSESSSGTYTEIGTSTSNSYTDAAELASNVTYYYKVSVRNDTLEGDKSGSVSATVLLRAPVNVTAVGSSSNSITISWNAATFAGVYYVYIAENSSGPYTQIGSTSSLSYTSSNLATATTFYYKVEAKTGTYGTGGQLSDPVSATTLLTAPTGVKAESLTSSSITVSWNDFPTATAYRIYKSESSSGTYTEIGTSTSNSYTDAVGLASNVTYYYRVSVRNNTLEGDKSGSVSATVLLHAPTGVTAAAASSSSITVSWNAVTNAGVYYVYRSENSSGPYTQVGSTSSLSYTSSNLATATTFYYKVEAKTGTYGTGGQLSDPVSATTL